jgi:hypothetical protein
MSDFYCRECGCRILCGDDIGYWVVETERLKLGVVGEAYEEVEHTSVVCRACRDEQERAWEAFQKTPEYQIECDFYRWCKETAKNAIKELGEPTVPTPPDGMFRYEYCSEDATIRIGIDL